MSNPYWYLDPNAVRDARLRELLATPCATPDEPTDTVGHWQRLLVAQRALSYPVGFASARVPARFARQVAASFVGHGFCVRCSDPYPTAESGELRCVVTVWDSASPRTQQQQQQHKDDAA